MRIIGGVAGGRLLKVPKGLSVRPTPDLVRQAIFNSLGERVIDARVLELFGGTGALSFECLSRGARSAVCVEKSGKHARMIRFNARDTGLADHFDLRVQDAFAACAGLAERGDRFDLLMADPPYGEKNLAARSKSFAQKCLDDERIPELLSEGGLLVLGHAKRDRLELPTGWVEQKALTHGDSVFRFLSLSPASKE